jgi:hypothetical protein
MSSTYYLGQTVRFSVTVLDVTNAAVDPTTITLKLHDPGGAETAYTSSTSPPVVRDGVGQYHCDVALGLAGRWLVRWVTSGIGAATVEYGVDVLPSGFTSP